MPLHWNAQEDSLEIAEMPFYWRLSDSKVTHPNIPSRLGIRIQANSDHDFLQWRPNESDWLILQRAYEENENIGFLNPESGQLATYGTSVNNFFLASIESCQPKSIYEIGCGAGYSIKFLRESGWKVIGIDPSSYSAAWSEKLGFDLVNSFFDDNTLNNEADFIYCNDVFEHVRNVEQFARSVFRALRPGGAFCFATTNSNDSINLGDISMLEHQHVNMFTSRSIYSILSSVGFSVIDIKRGSYGNTFQVKAIKRPNHRLSVELPLPSCPGFFERAAHRINAFGNFYRKNASRLKFYVPLRCLPYLSTVGNFGRNQIFDSNAAWRGKFIDGYSQSIKSVSDIKHEDKSCFFIGSLTFFQEIRETLLTKGYRDFEIFSIGSFS